MPDEVTEGTPVATEQEELAVPDVSQAEQEVQQPSQAESETEDRLTKLLEAQEERFEAMEERLERMAQSAKDRGISKNAQEISAIRQQLEALGGDWGALQQQAERETLYNEIEQLKQRISQEPTAPARQEADPKSAWQAEWREESQKILDAAAKSGVDLAPEEYNSAMFNNGRPFDSKGDAYAALNQAILAKAKGENISIAAVATEGGDVAKPPAPPAKPKTAAQRFEEAKAAGDYEAMQAIQAERWDNVEKLQKEQSARQALDAAGLTAEDLIEQ